MLYIAKNRVKKQYLCKKTTQKSVTNPLIMWKNEIYVKKATQKLMRNSQFMENYFHLQLYWEIHIICIIAKFEWNNAIYIWKKINEKFLVYAETHFCAFL